MLGLNVHVRPVRQKTRFYQKPFKVYGNASKTNFRPKIQTFLFFRMPSLLLTLKRKPPMTDHDVTIDTSIFYYPKSLIKIPLIFYAKFHILTSRKSYGSEINCDADRVRGFLMHYHIWVQKIIKEPFIVVIYHHRWLMMYTLTIKHRQNT